MLSSKHPFRPGDWVIYRKQKSSTVPGPRASNVHAASKGNLYRYTVDKFWVIDSINEDGTLNLRTRRGKQHQVMADDPQLRRARLWERWIHRSRFEMIPNTPGNIPADVFEETASEPATSSKSAALPTKTSS